MLKKSGIAAAFLVGALLLAGQALQFSTTPHVNEWILSHHAIVDEQREAAPLASRIVVGVSRAPHEFGKLIGRIHLIDKARAQGQMLIDRGNMRNHQSYSCGSATNPTITGATETTGTCDFRGEVTAPTLSTITITFGTAYGVAPFCSVSKSDAVSTAGGWSVSTTALTITSVTTGASSKYNWICWGPVP